MVKTVLNDSLIDMQKSNKFPDFKILLLVGFFCLFLYKLSFSFGGEGLSGNYSFILLPLVLIAYSGKVKKPEGFFLMIIAVYVLIFALSTLYQWWFFEFFARRIISFLLFAIVFSYIFIEVNEEMILAFKMALIMISVFMSLNTIKLYIDLGGASLGFAAKDAVGGQRFGFVYVFALWIIVFENWKGIWKNGMKIGCLVIIFLGLLLTFSRSGLVAIFASAFVYASSTFYQLVKHKQIKELFKWMAFLFLVVIAGFIFTLIFPEILVFFDERLFSFFAKGGVEKLDLDNQEGSEGYRIYMFEMIIKYILHNPFTGSGYLGVWVLFEDRSGSSHNQYTDILFRTGVFGFAIYIYLLYKIGRFLFQNFRGMFWGFIGVIIYGLFHETFKESHGGFILAFLLGMLGSRKSLVKKFAREN